MALPASDDFTAADGTALTTHSASWTLCSGNFAIYSNAVGSSAGGECGAGWNADAFENDQYAKATVALIDTVDDWHIVGVAVRCDVTTPSANYYGFYGSDTEGYLFKIVAGVYTQFGAATAGFDATDVIRIEAEGTTITAKINGVTVRTADDNAFASGAAGICGYRAGEESMLGDWEGGNLVSGPGARSMVVVTL